MELPDRCKEADGQADCIIDKRGDDSFHSLVLTLEDWFASPLMDLPPPIRKRVDQSFAPIPWEELTEGQRRTVALQLDYQHDPAAASDRQFWWDHHERQEELKVRIAQWESVAAPTAGELALREARLQNFKQELDRSQLQERQAIGDYYPQRKPPGGASQASSTSLAPPLPHGADPKPIAPPGDLELGSREWRRQNAQIAANAKHDKPGGSREKQTEMRRLWNTGKYSDRNACADEECGGLNMSFSTARKALMNTPDPPTGCTPSSAPRVVTVTT